MTSLKEGKVVRDGLVLPIIDTGNEVHVRRLYGAEAYSALLVKLSEELDEMFQAFHNQDAENIAEKIADVIEVLAGLGNLAGVDELMVQENLDKKYEEKGGFHEVYFVKVLDDEEVG